MMKKLLKNKLILSLGTAAIVAAPITLMTSCGSSQKGYISAAFMKELQKHDFARRNEKFDLAPIEASRTNIKDAKIISWIDGDTPTVQIYDDKGVPVKDINGNPQTTNIRVTAIDTPESHVLVDKATNTWASTTGQENVWAEKAHHFGQKEMPKETKIKIWTDGSKSYQRIVGSLFYKKAGDTLYRNYGVEILRNGLATPFVSNAGIASSKSSVLNLIGIPLADAYNYALKTKQGLFGTDLNAILQEHGMTSDDALRYRAGKFDPSEWGATRNIYDVLG